MEIGIYVLILILSLVPLMLLLKSKGRLKYKVRKSSGHLLVTKNLGLEVFGKNNVPMTFKSKINFVVTTSSGDYRSEEHPGYNCECILALFPDRGRNSQHIFCTEGSCGIICNQDLKVSRIFSDYINKFIILASLLLPWITLFCIITLILG